MLSEQELRESPLFENITHEEYRRMLVCFRASQRSFRPEQLIYDFTAGGVFGKTLAFSFLGEDSIEVVCRKDCEVLFIDYPHIMKRCENACTHHSILVQNMLQLMREKAQALSERVDVLSRRTIREKLMCYFRQMAVKTGEDSFVLPFSLSTLADYIATDRSAMMRELKKLRQEGIVVNDGRQFTLL